MDTCTLDAYYRYCDYSVEIKNRIFKFRKAPNFVTPVSKERKKRAYNKHFVLFFKAPHLARISDRSDMYFENQDVKIRR